MNYSEYILKLVFFFALCKSAKGEKNTQSLSLESRRANSPQKLPQIISLKLIVAELGFRHKMGSKHGN
jgi:hypothetical protein